MTTLNETAIAPKIREGATVSPTMPQVNHRASAIEMIEKALAPLLDLRTFMQEHPEFTAVEFANRWNKFADDQTGSFAIYGGLATDEAYNVHGGSERLLFPYEPLQKRLIDPKAPVRQQMQTAIEYIAEQGEALLAFLHNDPDGFDLLGYGTALHRVQLAKGLWGTPSLIGTMLGDLMST